ncbi:hypothetical protein COV15_02215 [Candidatus Woesearchaeota archaeon CG10_big_fil_rev_8_21_14_0_10_34_12]|nr:MAG: hypothetical protein COV15_02215 [Candidatus Woesearchaeota archaeon CG10_big_fil_rev_8_21_14_0_10_34_12]
MKKLLFLLVASVLFFSLAGFATAQDYSTVSLGSDESCTQIAGEPYHVFFFYGDGCPHCAQVSPLMEELSKKYTNYTFTSLEIYRNDTNAALFSDFVERYGVERAGIPAVFISQDALIGFSQIKNNIEERLDYYLKNKPICPMEYNKKEATSHEISPKNKIQLTLPAIIIAAIADSVNPCAFAVLIFLLLYLETLGANKRMLKVGIIYIITVFIVYFLSGLGLFVVIQKTGITSSVFKIAALIAIIAGLINIKDFFWYGKGITLAIPESKKPLIEKYIKKASLPAAIVLGILVSMFELPCTGGVYLAILALIASNANALAIPYLLLYNFIFVLPLFIILFVVYRGASVQKAEETRQSKRKWLRLIMGIVMLALGISMLWGIL